MLTSMKDKTVANGLMPAFKGMIAAYASYGKTVKSIHSDYEVNLRACEKELNKLKVQMSLRIPHEHEKIAERTMRTIRDKMRAGLRSLDFKLPPMYYAYLAMSCVRAMNLTPNSKSLPRTPYEMVRGEKANYLTDFHPAFGTAAMSGTSPQTIPSPNIELGSVSERLQAARRDSISPSKAIKTLSSEDA